MKSINTVTGVVWLDVPSFAAKMQKQESTIRKWCQTGFVVELGFLLHHDPTGHWRIGITPSHSDYREFR